MIAPFHEIFLVNRTVMGLYYTHLRKATLDTLAKNNDKISGEQILKVNKVNRLKIRNRTITTF